MLSVIGIPTASALSVAATAAMLPRSKAAAAKVRKGTGNLRLLVGGDSTTRGYGAAGDATTYQKGYPPKLSARLNQSDLMLPSTWQGFFGSSRSTSYASLDSRVAVSGGFASVVNSPSLGGGWWACTATGTMTFTPTQDCDTFTIWYLCYNTGSFTVNLDGGSTLSTVNVTGSSSIHSVTVTGTLGAHGLNIVWVSGTVQILGVEAYDSATKQICVINAGSSGSNSSNWATNTAAYTSGNAIVTIDPDVFLFCIGINDYTDAITAATTLTNISTLIAPIKTAGIDVILKTPVPSAVSARTRAVQQTYNDAIVAAATANNCPVIDTWTRFGTQEAMNTLGLYADTLHPNELGYLDDAAGVFNALAAVL